MDLHLLPLHERERTAGQGQECGALVAIEELAHADPVHAVPTARRHIARPDHRPRDDLVEAREAAAGPEAVAHVRDGALDARLVLGVKRARRVDDRAMMLGELAVRAVEPGVVQVRFEHARLQVVADPRARASPEEAEIQDDAGWVISLNETGGRGPTSVNADRKARW